MLEPNVLVKLTLPGYNNFSLSLSVAPTGPFRSGVQTRGAADDKEAFETGASDANGVGCTAELGVLAACEGSASNGFEMASSLKYARRNGG
jgi:hypothetical protein